MTNWCVYVHGCLSRGIIRNLFLDIIWIWRTTLYSLNSIPKTSQILASTWLPSVSYGWERTWARCSTQTCSFSLTVFNEVCCVRRHVTRNASVFCSFVLYWSPCNSLCHAIKPFLLFHPGNVWQASCSTSGKVQLVDSQVSHRSFLKSGVPLE